MKCLLNLARAPYPFVDFVLGLLGILTCNKPLNAGLRKMEISLYLVTIRRVKQYSLVQIAQRKLGVKEKADVGIVWQLFGLFIFDEKPGRRDEPSEHDLIILDDE